MDSNRFSASPCGRIIRTRREYDAFVPDPLPPVVTWADGDARALERASLAVGELSGYLQAGCEHFMPLLLRADAVAAARSEFGHFPLREFLCADMTGVHVSRASRLASNYVAAFEYARNRLHDLPFSLRLIRELHCILFNDTANQRSTPGRFRRSQNWVGHPGCTLSDALFVPPPPMEMHELLDNWEHYLHRKNNSPALARLALAHYQFLVIHPFLDMNDATGALMASVLLVHLGLVGEPLPFLGHLLERNRANLQRRMLDTCATGEWEKWLTWYLYGLADSAHTTIDSARKLTMLYDTHSRLLTTSEATDGTMRVFDLLFHHGALAVRSLIEEARLTSDDATRAVQHLTSLGITNPSHEGNDIYVAPDIVAALDPVLFPDTTHSLPF